MKKITYLFMIAAAAYAFQGCGNANKDAKDTADSLNETKDTTTNVAATGGIGVEEADAKFATDAANAGMAEVALGKLASEKGTAASIKEFGAMMVKDHTKANEELMAIAKTKNITLPSTVDAEHQAKMDELMKLSGAEFDKAYAKAMVDGHQKVLDMMQGEAKDGKDADLKAFASKTAPVVKMHLDMITKINDGMK